MTFPSETLVLLGLGILDDDARKPRIEQPPLIDGVHLRWAFAREKGFPDGGFYLYRRLSPTGREICLFGDLPQEPRDLGGQAIRLDAGDLLAAAPLRLERWSGGSGKAPSQGLSLAETALRFRPKITQKVSSLRLKIGFKSKASLQIRGAGGLSRSVQGFKDQVVEVSLAAARLPTLEISKGPALLLDICFSLPGDDDDVLAGWEPLPDAPRPITLPLFHPAYRATDGRDEDLEAARELAKIRVHYGASDRFDVASRPSSPGRISVRSGSPVVRGLGTGWTEGLVGTTLTISGQQRVYTILRVDSRHQLVLTRPYESASIRRQHYSLSEDPFAQMHDQLAVLVQHDSGSQHRLALPAAIPLPGQVNAQAGSNRLTGSGTDWRDDLVGLSIRLGVERKAMISIRRLSQVAVLEPGEASLGPEWVGGSLLIEGESSPLMIVESLGSDSVGLDRPWPGFSGAHEAWLAGPSFEIQSVSSPTEMQVDGVWAASFSQALASISISARQSGDPAPAFQSPRPLDYLLLAALHPAYAQALGLAWIDQQAEAGVHYDYLLLADYGSKQKIQDAAEVLSDLMGERLRFSDVEAAIIRRRRTRRRRALGRPRDGEALVLPSGSIRETSSHGQAVGLRWSRRRRHDERLAAEEAVMHHVYVAELGHQAPTAAPGESSYVQLTREQALVIAREEARPPGIRPPADWPSDQIYYLDINRPPGWHSYRLAAVDIFGRFSGLSEACQWRMPPPSTRPQPWFLKDPPPAQARLVAVALLDKRPPPRPEVVAASVLDPRDRHAPMDSRSQQWLSEAPMDLVALRVSWRWPAASQRAAPDLAEFRIYFEYGRSNVYEGSILSVRSSSRKSKLSTDLMLDLAPDALDGCHLRAGGANFLITSGSSNPLRLTVRNGGLDGEKRPMAGPCQLVIPPAITRGTATVEPGSRVVRGRGVSWPRSVRGQGVSFGQSPDIYRIAERRANNSLELDRPYEGTEPAQLAYAMRHPLFRDYRNAEHWSERLAIIEPAAHFEEIDGDRHYVTIVSAPGGSFEPDQGNPLRRGFLGVTAADDRVHSADSWPGDGPLAGRPGNESEISGPAVLIRVLQSPPDPPQSPRIEDLTWLASPADYQGDSFIDLPWLFNPHVEWHVYRALDETLFQVDARHQPRSPVAAEDQAWPPDWSPERRQRAAAALAELSTTIRDGSQSHEAAYRNLAGDALRLLAGLENNEAAFQRLTERPFKPAGQPADGETVSFRARLDGRSRACWFFRLAAVNPVHTLSQLGPALPPVHAPDVVPPIPPLWKSPRLDDGEVLLRWLAGPEHDLAHYRVYRSELEENASDIRRMQRVAEVPAPGTHALEIVTWRDEGLGAGQELFYRLVTVDLSGHPSQSSKLKRVLVIDDRPPAPPAWESISWIQLAEDDSALPLEPGADLIAGRRAAVRCQWQSDLQGARFFLSRRAHGRELWRPVAGPADVTELGAGLFRFDDQAAGAVNAAWYRLRVAAPTGAVSVDFDPIEAPSRAFDL